MSVTGPKRHRFILALALVSTAAIAACDTPTEPRGVNRIKPQTARLEGDSTLCTHGFIVVQGVIVCNDPG
jgi:hypothetical protein